MKETRSAHGRGERMRRKSDPRPLLLLSSCIQSPPGHDSSFKEQRKDSWKIAITAARQHHTMADPIRMTDRRRQAHHLLRLLR